MRIEQSPLRPRVVAIGGGTGSHVVLTGLRRQGVRPTAVVSVADSGGSSGRLRDEFGHLPPGDVRQCLVALMPDDYQSLLLRQLFTYRFDRGEGLNGHSFGNLFLTALIEITGSFERAIEVAAELLKIDGRVVPVSLGRTGLCARLHDGTTLCGEGAIDQRGEGGAAIDYVYLDPRVFINPKAKAAILEADLVVLGPGDLFTSVVPPLLVDGMVDALRETTAKRVYVVNIMTKPGESSGYHAIDFIETIQEYLGGAPLDGVIVNTGVPAERVLARYKSQGQDIVPVDDGVFPPLSRVVLCDLITSGMFVRHDPDRLAATLCDLWEKLTLGVAEADCRVSIVAASGFHDATDIRSATPFQSAGGVA